MLLNNYSLTLRFLLTLLIGCFLIVQPAFAQDKKGDQETEEKSKKSENKNAIKAFEDVIKEGATTDEGLFDLHLLDEKLYFEIPNNLLGVDMLLVSRISQRPQDLSPYINAGSKTNEQVVRWERKGKKILLKGISYSNVADEELPIYLSVRSNNFEPIIAAFDIEAFNRDSSGVVIEVSKFYLSDNSAISGLSSSLRKQYEIKNMDKDRSFLDTARSYPINIEITHTMTYNAGNPPGNSD
ncbi:MAG: DUF5117 domain-containing protein, partial [Bacteroidetes bacterium]|nr:DUF5117 domain-containing protein [Bacteroidota bacterium]